MTRRILALCLLLGLGWLGAAGPSLAAEARPADRGQRIAALAWPAGETPTSLVRRPPAVASAAALWTPLDLGTNLAAWYDPSDVGSVTLSAGNVAQIDDLSGNGRHATQATPGNRVPYVANEATMGGRGALVWPSVTNNAHLLTPAFSVSDWIIVTAYGDGARATWVTGNQGLFGWNNASGLGLGPIAATTPSSPLWFTSSSGFSNVRRNGGAAANLSSGIVALPLPMTTVHASSPTGAITAVDGWVIGRDRSITNRGWSGAVGEIIALSVAPTQAVRELIEGYLAHKWWGAGALNPLPVEHPHKHVPPMVVPAPTIALPALDFRFEDNSMYLSPGY